VTQFLIGRMAIKAQHLQPGQGAGFEVGAGQFIQIITLQGKQVADFVAWNQADHGEHLSTAHTRSINNGLMLSKDQQLFSNRRNAMLTLVDDTVGRHDMLFAACDPLRYANDFGIEDHANCRDAIVGALAGHGIGNDDVHDPINFFMNIGLVEKGAFEARESLAEKNDFVLLRAEMDVLVAVTACPQDQTPINGGAPSDVLVRIYR